jgi:hypothetical protein
MFIAGIRPEIGICIEYLSWNKEHRLYIGWMRDIYALLFGNATDSHGDLRFKIPT